MRIAVVGGSGFLGKHVVQMLAESFSDLTEILVLDLLPFPADFEPIKFGFKVRWIEGDIRDLDTVMESFQGVDAVIHAAGVIEIGNYPDLELMHSVNVDGTKNIVEACISCSVQALVFTGTSEMGRTFNIVENENEESVDQRCLKNHKYKLLDGYATSKHKAEGLVLSAHGQKLANGHDQLRTVSLRPVGIYGEGDVKFVPTFIRSAKQFFSILPHIGPWKQMIQRVYVGNVAWVHVLALKHLLTSNSAEAGGQSFIVADDTPLTSHFHFIKPFVEAHQIKLLPLRIPLWLAFACLFLIEFFINLLKPLVKIRLSVTTEELFLACSTCYYDITKCRRILNYEPRYSPQEALQRSFSYYSGLKLQASGGTCRCGG